MIGPARPTTLQMAFLVLFPAYSGAQISLGGSFVVNVATTGNQEQSTVSMEDDGSFVVAWTDANANQDDILQRRYSFDGVPTAVSTLNQNLAGSQAAASLSSNGAGDFAVVWRSVNQVPNSAGDLFARRTSFGGSVLSNEFPINATTEQNTTAPVVRRAESGDFVVVWHDVDAPFSLFGRLFDANGDPVTGELVINTDPFLAEKGYALAARPDGGFVVAWTAVDSSFLGILARCYDANGAPLGEPFEVNQAQTLDQRLPALASDSQGAFVVAWLDEFPTERLRMRLYAPDCSPRSGDLVLDGGFAGGVEGLQVDMAPDGAFVVVWDGFGQEADGGISAREFGKSGAPVGDPFIVNDVAFSSVQRDPEVGIGDDQFVVSWTHDVSGSFDDIHGRRYSRRVVFGDDFESANLFYWSLVGP